MLARQIVSLLALLSYLCHRAGPELLSLVEDELEAASLSAPCCPP